MFLLGLALNAFASDSAPISSAAPLELPLWSQEQLVKLEEPEKVTDRSKDPTKPNRAVTQVENPTITLYRPPGDVVVSAVVICPGGGYASLSIDKEGKEVARWFQSQGIAGIVLKYRLPRVDLSANQKPWPLQDAEQAMKLARSHANEWGINPASVGIMGFSAGGHLASTLGTHFAQPETRPDFMILAYPVVTFRAPLAHMGSRTRLIGSQPDPKLVDFYSNEIQVKSGTPPAFIVHAKDDRVSKVENSIQFRDAMQKAGVPCELLLLDKGGHGFGLDSKKVTADVWPDRCLAWLKMMKFVE